MDWFLNLATRTKLWLAFLIMMSLLAAMAVTAYLSLAELRASQADIVEREFAIVSTLKELTTNQNAVRAAALTLALTRNRQEQQAALQEIQQEATQADALMTRLLELGGADARFSARVEEFRSTRLAYRHTRDQEMLPLIEAGNPAAALALMSGVQGERHERLRAIAAELEAQAEERARQAVARSEQQGRRASLTFTALVGLALVLAGALVVYMNRIIAAPLQQVSRVAERIAAGDLSGQVTVDGRRDEVGVLAATFQQMLDNLRQMTGEIGEGVNVLASAASEIMASASQLASGAAETASSVSETTSTVEEVKQTAQVSSQKARHVSETAQRSVQVSQSGQKVVEEMMEGMHRIREHMESIAESIVRLSEQGQAIGEIIATVNDLADQSNLLAVNAAIEAAKAGEQGKGFSVVAQEMRSLAEQSKQGTAQVRTLLGEIQKATNAAVMAAEQGGKSVEAGVKQSSQAGEAVRKLAESIAEAAQAATQIAASAQQQLAGMDQVALAMENIKQASSQSVASTTQAETAARNLNETGQRLKQLAGRYQL